MSTFYRVFAVAWGAIQLGYMIGGAAMTTWMLFYLASLACLILAEMVS